MKDWTWETIEAYDDFMESWANSHLCETQPEKPVSEEPEAEFTIVELKAVSPF